MSERAWRRAKRGADVRRLPWHILHRLFRKTLLTSSVCFVRVRPKFAFWASPKIQRFGVVKSSYVAAHAIASNIDRPTYDRHNAFTFVMSPRVRDCPVTNVTVRLMARPIPSPHKAKKDFRFANQREVLICRFQRK